MKQRSMRTSLVIAASALLLTACFGNSAEQYLAAAKTEIDKKDRSAAVIQLKNALQKNPALAEARFLLGQMLLEGGDVRGAVIELEKARELGFSADRLATPLAMAMLAQGQFEKLVSQFAEAKLPVATELADLKASVASAYIALGKPAQARASIDAALAADANNVRAQLIHVRLLASSAEGLPGALKAIDEVLAKLPRNADAWLLKGQLLNASSRSEPALEAFRQAIQLDPKNVAAHAGALTLLLTKNDLVAVQKQFEGMKASLPNHPQTRMFLTMLALERGDLKLARENVQALLKAAPEDVRVLHLAGAIEFRRGALLQAESYLNKALKAAPNVANLRVLLARTYLRSGDTVKALAVLQPSLGAESASAESLGLAAETYLQQGDTKRAEEFFARANKLDPKDARSRTSLAMVQVAKGNVEQGLTELQSISNSNANPVADLALINTYLQRREVDKALKAIDALEAKLPGKPTAANLRGRVELARGNKDKARQAFEAALKTDPVFFPAAASLAALDFEAKNVDAATARFKNILAIEPKNVLANMAVVAMRERSGAGKEELAQLIGKLVKDMPDEAAPRLALIRVQMDRKEPKLALAAAQDAVAALPDNAEIWTMLGRIQAAAGDANQALIAFNKVVTMQPNLPEPNLHLAEFYLSQKNMPAATQSLKRALVIKSDFLPAQTALLSIELSAGHIPEARALAKSIQVQRATDSIGLALEADIEASQKNWSVAAEKYRAAMRIRAPAELAVKLHRVLQAGGKAADATQFETSWLKEHTQDAMFLNYLGDVALTQQNYALAEQRYMAVLKIHPDHVPALNNIAWLLHKAKKPAALDYAEKANKLMPGQPALMDTLAEIHADAGRFDKALEIQKQAVALAPDFATHRLHLAQIYAAAGQKAAARDELSKLSALGDKFLQQAEVKKLLLSL